MVCMYIPTLVRGSPSTYQVYLNVFVVFVVTTASGRLFYIVAARCIRKFRRISLLALSLFILIGCPPVLLFLFHCSG